MRWLVLTCLVSAVASGASGAELKGRVLLGDSPVAKAQVRVFGPRDGPLPGCAPGATRSRSFGRCMCPDGQGAFISAVLAKGFVGVEPVATAVTAADGTFSVAVNGAGPFTAFAQSADGKRAAKAPLNQGPNLVRISDSGQTQLKLEGMTEGAKVFLFDSQTYAATPLVQQGDKWSSGPGWTGITQLVAVAPGAQVGLAMLLDGRPVHLAPFGGTGVWSLRLAAPLPVRGLVVDEKGKPVADAELTADPESCALKAWSDAKGRFTTPAMTSAPFLTALLAKSAGRVARADADSGAFVELTLGPAGRLDLTLVDAQQKPAAGVVAWLSGPHTVGRRVASDAAGRWSESDLVEGKVEVRIESPWRLAGDRAIDVKGTVKKTLQVEKGVELTVRVVNAGREPVPGVRVSVAFGDALQKTATAGMKDALRELAEVSDSNGEVRFLLMPGEYELIAKRQQAGESAVLAMVPGTVELQLATVPAIEGVVLDPARKPVANASVRAMRSDMKNHTLGTTAAADGTFRLEVHNPGTFELLVSAAEGGEVKKSIVEVGTTGAKVEVQVSSVAGVRGVLLDPAGKPVAGAKIEGIASHSPLLAYLRANSKTQVDPAQLLPGAKAMRHYVQATTGADGSFVLPTAADTLLFVQGADATAEPVMATTKERVVMTLAPRSKVQGRVVDMQGQAVTRFTVNGEVFRGADGRFEKVLPARGAFELKISADLAPTEVLTIEVPASVQVIDLGTVKLRQGFVIAGQIRGLDGKQPEQAFVRLKSEGLELSTSVASDGRFAFKGVAEGFAKLSASANSCEPVTMPVKAGDRGVVVMLGKAGALLVKVNRRGYPVADAQLQVQREGEMSRREATGSAGDLKLDRLAPGEWTVVLLSSPFNAEPAPPRKVTVLPGKTATIELQIK